MATERFIARMLKNCRRYDQNDTLRSGYLPRALEAGAARGRRIASWPSLKTDLRSAGAEWIDEEAGVDGNLVSSRKADDIPAFNRAMIKLFARMCAPMQRTV